MQSAVMSQNFVRHIDPEDLESYSRQSTSDEDNSRIEEHLLVCENCRNELDRVDSYLAAIRSSVKLQPRIEFQPGPAMRPWWNPRWLVPAFAALVLIVGGVVTISRFGRNSLPPLALTLTTSRGTELGPAVPAGRSLFLTPDLTGLPENPRYRLEIVDENGSKTWEGRYTAGQGAATVPGQRVGPHFVRIYSSGGELLREYGLDVKE
jgi:hypothetical protein